jgi:hypothetical protein
MKKIFYLLLLITGFANAQIVNIPDVNFKNALLSADTSNGIAKDENGINILVDVNSDDEIQISEALLVFELDVDDKGIADLTGIEEFVNLTSLMCSQNDLTELDVSTLVNLELFSCGSNNLTEIDLSSNPNLEVIYTVQNPFEYVNIKNGTGFSPNFIGTGTWQEQWWNLPDGAYVCADDFEVDAIQDEFDFFGNNCNVTSYCTFYPGGEFNTITGSLLFDSNNDAQCDNNDVPQDFLKIDISDGTGTDSDFADTNGNYIFYTQAGNYTLTPQVENPSFFTINPATATVNFPIVDNSTQTENFCIVPDGIRPDVEIVIAPTSNAVPGFFSSYKLVYRNKGNQMISGNIQLQFDDDLMDFLSSTPNEDSQSTGNLTYNFSNLLPFEERSILVNFNLNSSSDTPPLNIDDVLTFISTINSDQGDEFPDDNTYDLNQIVVGSYDPNDIICLEGEVVDQEMIGEELHYMIRFENTGNFPAQNIVITMPIDETEFDVSSLKILNSSHELKARVVGNTAEFFFNQIQLDSGGHGNILLVLKSLEGLNVGDSVSNQADIYFDYNYPVTTNEAITTFELLSTNEVEINSISIYPNPAKNEFNIQSENKINSIEIYDVAGRLIQVSKLDSNQSKQDISKLPVGIYLLKIHTEKGIVTYKLIKK